MILAPNRLQRSSGNKEKLLDIEYTKGTETNDLCAFILYTYQKCLNEQ